MEKLIPEIFIEGLHFSPRKLRELIPALQMRLITEKGDLGKSGRSYSSGSCILTPPEKLGNDEAVDLVICWYEEIQNYGQAALRIEKLTFNLYVDDVAQSNFTISSRNLKKIADFFEKINFIVLERP